MSKQIVWALVALLAAALIGHKIGHWRAVAEGAEAAQEAAADALIAAGKIQAQTETIGELRLQIADQNKSIAVAQAQADGARQVQEEAKLRADEAAKLSQSRLAKIDKALEGAKTAGDVLARYWEIRQ